MPVALNVGGKKFYTLLETLKKNPGPRDKSVLANMNFVEGEEVFIDRDPTHFDCILNYLRDGSVSVEGNGTIRARIKREAQYYGLEDLVQHIERQPQPTTVNGNSTAGNRSSQHEWCVLTDTVSPEVLESLTPGPYFAIPIPKDHH